jgi:hypothetical protein
MGQEQHAGPAKHKSRGGRNYALACGRHGGLEIQIRASRKTRIHLPN